MSRPRPPIQRGVWTEDHAPQVPDPGLPDLTAQVQLRRLRGQPDLSFADLLSLARGETRLDPEFAGTWFAHLLWGLPRVTPLQADELRRGMGPFNVGLGRREGTTFSLAQAWPSLVALRLAWLTADEVQALEDGPPQGGDGANHAESDPASWLSNRRANLQALMNTAATVMECGDLMADLRESAAEEGISDLLRDGGQDVPAAHSVLRPVHFIHWGLRRNAVAWRIAAALNASEHTEMLRLNLLENLCAADQPPGPQVCAATGPLNRRDPLITTSRADPALILAAVNELLAAREEQLTGLSPGLKAALGACHPIFQALTCVPGVQGSLAATQLTTLAALLALGPQGARALAEDHTFNPPLHDPDQADPTGVPELTALLLTHPSAHTPTLEAIRAALGTD